MKNAFLHGQLNETVFMSQPLGYVSSVYPDHVCLLNRALYGLKQAPRAWFDLLTTFLHKIIFQGSKSDYSMFVYSSSVGMAVLLLYVDDIIITASATTLLDDLIGSLKKEFQMTDLGTLYYFLGIEVQSLHDGLFLCQQKYVSDLLECVGMLSCKSVATPLPT